MRALAYPQGLASGGRAKAVPKALSAARFWRWYFGALLFALTTPFEFQLRGIDPAVTTVALDSATLHVAPSLIGTIGFRAATILAGLLPLCLRPRSALRTMAGLAPLAPFLLLCVASLLWTDNLQLSIQANLILAGEILAGLGLATWFSGRDLVRVLVGYGTLVALGSLLSIVLMPRYGVHQVVDIGLHPGAWRGAYGHKNALGHVCAALFVFAVCTPSPYFGGKWLRVVFAAAQLGLVIGSTSAGGIVVIAVGLFAYLVVYRTPMFIRVPIVLISPLAFWLAQAARSSILLALGRDETLSGRSYVWDIARQYISQRPILGYGFGATTYGGFSRDILQWMHVDNPHNGYLDIAMSLGYVGLLVFIFSVMSVFYVASRSADRRELKFASAIAISWLVSGVSEAAFRPGGAPAATAYVVLTAMACIALTRKSRGRDALCPVPLKTAGGGRT